MKLLQLSILTICTAVLVGGCFGVGKFQTAEEGAQELRDTHWILVPEQNFTLSPSLDIDDNLQTVSGNTGCNNYSADIVMKNYSFEINSFVKTEMFCDIIDEEERNYFINLSNAVQFRILREDVLLLKNKAGKIILRYKKSDS